MWEIINFLGCVGWIMGAIGLIAIWAARDASIEREKQEAATEKTKGSNDAA